MVARQIPSITEIKSRYFSIVRGAFKRHLTVRFSSKEFISWVLETPEVCSYCGVPFHTYLSMQSFAKSYSGKNAMVKKYAKFTRGELSFFTIERVNENQGYTPRNVCKCCSACQTIKNTLYQEHGVMEPSLYVPLVRDKMSTMIRELVKEGWDPPKK